MTLTTDNSFFFKHLGSFVWLRWLAAISIAMGALITYHFLGTAVHQTAVYILAGSFLAYNFVIFLLLRHYSRSGSGIVRKIVKQSIDYQIALDILFLVFLLHYSGGIESPYVFFVILHMIVVSSVLPVWKSFFEASLAVLLFGGMVLLEYSGFVPHHCLKGYIIDCFYRDNVYVLGSTLVLAITLYLTVFITTTILTKIIKQIEHLHEQVNVGRTEQDRFIDEYVVSFTHDVKGDLAAIQSCLAIVLKGSLDKQSFEFASRSYNRTKKLASHMKIFIKLTNARLDNKIQITRLPLKQLIEDAVNTLRSKTEEKSIKLNYSVSTNGQNIYGIESSIEEILSTVLINTIMFTSKNSKITVRVTNETNLVQLQISNTGINISKSDLSKVFNKYYWADKEKDVAFKSVASKLIRIKRFVEDRGGEIEANCKNGKETNLIITIPCFCRMVKT